MVPKILMQLFRKRLIIANVSGWSSVWGGSFTKVPFVVDERGRGPAWTRSFFENKMLLKPHAFLMPSILCAVSHQVP
jgi:pyruvate/2-oxoacid:ferredoxin oxidoreductase beta subunit